MSRSVNSAGLRVVAAFEAAKGLLVLAVGFGLLALAHKDLQDLGEQWLLHLHLNPASRYPQIFLKAIGSVHDARLTVLAAAATAYALMRFVEAYGLWRKRRWAEWFAVATGGVYMLVELYELTKGVNWVKAAVFLINTGIVIYIAYALRHPRQPNLKVEG
jgi:uncharacterized membrane protein (DUF2068 family)